MGLAASQARFLGITARKNSCELRSMQIAQEKLSITNQLTRLSENYQNSLDATRLVWDSEYITDGSIYDVSYGLLMLPSSLNNYTPQLLTNFKNQIVLDSQFANAMKKVNLKGVYDSEGNIVDTLTLANMKTGGSPRTKDNFIQFLEGLNQGGIIAQSDLTKMKNALNQHPSYYNPSNGVGGFVKDKFTSNAMNLPTLTSFIDSIIDINSEYMNELRKVEKTAYNDDGSLKTYTKEDGTTATMEPTKYDQAVALGKLLNFENHKYKVKEKNDAGNLVEVEKTGTFGEACSKDIKTDLTISEEKFDFGDLLNKEVTLSSKNSTDMANALISFIGDLYSIMTNFFEINPESVDKEYLDFAMSQICALNGLEWVVQSYAHPKPSHAQFKGGDIKNFEAAALDSGNPAFKHTGLIKNGDTYSTSLSNLTRGLLTYFEKAVEGFSAAYVVESEGDRKVENSFYITQDPEYRYIVDNPTALDDADNTQLLLNYYSQLFNQICMNGWTQNDKVNDNEDLKNMLKNGTLFTSALADDGNFYQGPYTSNNYIAEVTDENAIAKAEAEFKTKQLQLSAKEEELNIDMQLVDAELAALTTEYDTVKNMISKAVEKGFSTLGG